MSSVKIQGDSSGTGVLTIAAPNTNTDRTINIPDTAGDIVTTGDSGTVTAPMLDGGQSGSAPAFACRAWVSFNGTGTVAIRASGNVSSVVDTAVGAYTVSFTTSMPDGDHVTHVTTSKSSGGFSASNSSFGMLREYLGNASSTIVYSITSAGAGVDRDYICVSVFR
jgi:hypothetical protein